MNLSFMAKWCAAPHSARGEIPDAKFGGHDFISYRLLTFQGG